MATTGSRGIKGPLFDDEEGPDVLDLVEHLLDLKGDQAINKMSGNTEKTGKWITALVLLDIARSLRKISTGGALYSPYRTKYSGSGF